MMMIMMMQARSEEPRKKIYDDDDDQSLSKTTQGPQIVLQQQLQTQRNFYSKMVRSPFLEANWEHHDDDDDEEEEDRSLLKKTQGQIVLQQLEIRRNYCSKLVRILSSKSIQTSPDLPRIAINRDIVPWRQALTKFSFFAHRISF
jgi:hypothetical protein